MQASKRGQAGTSRRKRIAAAKLSEAGGQGRGRAWTPPTLERLTVKGLTRYYHGINDEARRALVAADPPPLAGTVWNAVIAATVEHACPTRGAEAPTWTQVPERFRAQRGRVRDAPEAHRRAADAQRWSGVGRARSRGATAPRDGTAELAPTAARRRSRTPPSPGARAVERPGPHVDRWPWPAGLCARSMNRRSRPGSSTA